MALYNVPNQGGRVPTRGLPVAASNSGAKATIKQLTDQVEELSGQVSLLTESLALYENEDGSPKDSVKLNDQVKAYSELIEQFKDVLGSDRDTIFETASELEVEFKKNDADRDILARIFSKMCEMML